MGAVSRGFTSLSRPKEQGTVLWTSKHALAEEQTSEGSSSFNSSRFGKMNDLVKEISMAKWEKTMTDVMKGEG